MGTVINQSKTTKIKQKKIRENNWPMIAPAMAPILINMRRIDKTPRSVLCMYFSWPAFFLAVSQPSKMDFTQSDNCGKPNTLFT